MSWDERGEVWIIQQEEGEEGGEGGRWIREWLAPAADRWKDS